MSIKDWHGGKIALIWVIALIVVFVLLNLLTTMAAPQEESAFLILALSLLALLAGASLTPCVITWKWLSGK